MPQLPTTTVVTPCDSFGIISGWRTTLVSSCVWTSMKPGASTSPAASMTSAAAAEAMRCSASPPSASMSTMRAMRPSRSATSATRAAAPEPSITVAPRISVS